MEPPFLRRDSVDYAEVPTDAAVHLLAGKGIDRFSVRAIARWMKVAPATILGDYTRARVLELVLICFRRRWLAWSASEPLWGPTPARVPLRLPLTSDERVGVRVYSALGHLAEAERLRGNSRPASLFERIGREEAELLRVRMRPRCCDADAGDTAVHGVMALASGLRSSLSGSEPPLDSDAAVDLLADYVSLHTVHRDGCDSARIAS
jgi:hypothetical protein